MKQSLKILLLEDSLIDLELIERELLKIDRTYTFYHAKDKKDFLAALDEFNVDIILSDNSISQFNATEALQAVQSRGLKVPFIIVTGTMSEEFAVESIQAGADDYILKDRLTRLNAAVEAALLKKQTEKEKSEALHRLIRSEEQYRSLVERISDGFMSLDTNLTITYINKVAAEMLGKNMTGLTGVNLYALFPEGKNGSIYSAFRRALDTKDNVYLEEYSQALQIWIMGSIYPSASGVSVYFRDITEKKKLEAELEEQKHIEQLHLVAARLEAQEKERNAIAAELHDNVNQILVGTSMMMGQVIRNPQQHLDKLPICMSHLNEAITENRKIAHELVSPDVAETGLMVQLVKLTGNMLETNDIKVNIIDTDCDLCCINDKQMLAVYRIAQEQCTNIIKYAKATLVTIELSTSGGKQFSMKITDDGIGMQKAEKNKGIGMLNIASRLSLLNGEMNITSTQGKGFVLEISFPV